MSPSYLLIIVFPKFDPLTATWMAKVAKNRRCHVPLMAWKSKRSEAIKSFDNDVFFDIEAKRTHSIVGKFISKRSEHVYIKELKY